MVMNNNTIQFSQYFIEVPKMHDNQYLLLRYILMTIEKNQTSTSSYFIARNLFDNLDEKELETLLKKNIEITVRSRVDKSWSNFHVINDILIKEDKIFFRPANIIREIILQSTSSSKLSFLKYILFNGIRHKQTLLLLDYILKLDDYMFKTTIEDLKKILELREDQYKNFYALQKSIIDKAIQEINEKTSITIEYTITRKERKKVAELSFKYYTKRIN